MRGGVKVSTPSWSHQINGKIVSSCLTTTFRNMMKRDEEEHGRDYVEKGYPPRVAFCVPILIEEINAYHVATRATPEIIEAGTKPGTNLADKLLNETGMPPRTCVVLRISGEEGVENARGRLLDALRARQAHPSAKHVDTIRLAEVLRKRGLYEEAFPLLAEVLQLLETEFGVEHEDSLKAAADLGILYQCMGNYAKAEELYRRVLLSSEKILGSEHAGTLTSLNSLAGLLSSLVQSILMTSASLSAPVFFPHLHISTHKSLQHIPDLKSRRRECWRICFGANEHRMLAFCDRLWQMACNYTHPVPKSGISFCMSDRWGFRSVGFCEISCFFFFSSSVAVVFSRSCGIPLYSLPEASTHSARLHVGPSS